MTYLSEVLSSRELLANLVARELKGQYRRTALGHLWSLINPIATMIVYSLVFSFILRAEPDVGDPSGLDFYAMWLMCGLLPWLFFSKVITSGLGSIVSNSSLILKVYFPRVLLPAAVTLATMVTWGVEIAVLSIALVIIGGMPLPFLPLVVLAMVALAAFALGLAMILGILNARFRDTEHFVSIILPMWMWLSPVIYPITLVQDAAREFGEWILVIYQFNPFVYFLDVFRRLLYDNRIPDAEPTLIMTLVSAITFVVGYLVFARKDKRLAELL